jgi:hypothetical protein
MPGLVAGIHDLLWRRPKDVDGRNKSGYDEMECILAIHLAMLLPTRSNSLFYKSALAHFSPAP